MIEEGERGGVSADTNRAQNMREGVDAGEMENLGAKRLEAEDTIEESKQGVVSGVIGGTDVVKMSGEEGASGNSEAQRYIGEPDEEVFLHVEDDGSDESAR